MPGERNEKLQNPAFTGRAGRVWDVLSFYPPDRPTGIIGMWAIEISGRHNQLAMLAHLREVPGATPPFRVRLDATHRFTIYPLLVSIDNQPDIHAMSGKMDVGLECALPTDEKALEVARRALQHCADGRLPADEAHNPFWHAIFSLHEGGYFPFH